MCMKKNKEYKLLVHEAIENSRKDLIDLSIARDVSRPPTQASSEFLTNKKQGDWAEKTFIKNFNEQYESFVAVKYGRDNDLVAGEDGFKEFYEEYQEELDEIGKKPDILIFHKSIYQEEWNFNISDYSKEQLDEIVEKSICGIEIRSSSFLHKNYQDYSNEKENNLNSIILELKNHILNTYGQILKKRDKKIFETISNISSENIIVDFRSPSWKKTEDEIKLCEILKTLNENIRELKKRNFLSITPKVEDLKVVYNWIQRYNIPHFYIQIFFDEAFGISFLEILEMISDETAEKKDYFIEKDTKNQNKTTIKIDTNICTKVIENIVLPDHFSEAREIGDRGRLLYNVNFIESKAIILKDALNQLLGINKHEI